MNVTLSSTTVAFLDGPKTADIIDVWSRDAHSGRPIHHWFCFRLHHDNVLYIRNNTTGETYQLVVGKTSDPTSALLWWLREHLADTE